MRVKKKACEKRVKILSPQSGDGGVAAAGNRQGTGVRP
jgi:hypothetical protein